MLSRHEYAKDSSQTKNIITHGLLMLQRLMLHSLFGIPNKELISPYLFSKFIIICIFGYSRDWPRSTKSELSLIPHLCNVVKVVLLYFDMQAQPLQSFMQSSKRYTALHMLLIFHLANTTNGFKKFAENA